MIKSTIEVFASKSSFPIGSWGNGHCELVISQIADHKYRLSYSGPKFNHAICDWLDSIVQRGRYVAELIASVNLINPILDNASGHLHHIQDIETHRLLSERYDVREPEKKYEYPLLLTLDECEDIHPLSGYSVTQAIQALQECTHSLRVLHAMNQPA